jgi:glycosyltransferase involved in cell wall biosynthesis
VAATAARAAAARARRTNRDAFVVGMVARYEVHKDQPTLIRAAKLLLEQGRPIEVWLIGDGSRRAEYERMIAELGLTGLVQLLGVRRDVPELLGQLDAFAFATKPDEGQGVALVEAMAAGVPIVATDVGACCEVLDGGALGSLARTGDARSVADAIDDIRRNGAAWAARTERAQHKAAQAFSMESMAASYARCLRLVSEGPS